MHDLAVELGMTVADLRVRMGTREFASWRRYMKQRGLPSVRLQWQVALLALVVSRLAGNDVLSLDKYVVDFDVARKERERASKEQVQTATEGGSVLSMLAGANVRQIGKRKRKVKE